MTTSFLLLPLLFLPLPSSPTPSLFPTFILVLGNLLRQIQIRHPQEARRHLPATRQRPPRQHTNRADRRPSRRLR
jgi:hypothetical protein